MARISLADAIEQVRTRDPVLANLVALVGPIRYRRRNADGHFAAFQNPLARRDVYRFLDDLAKGMAPTIAPP